MRRAYLGVLIITLVLIAGLAPAVSAQSAEEDTGPTTIDNPGVSIDELRDGGSNLPDAPAGLRSAGTRLWYLEHYPAGAVFADTGSYDSPDAQYVTRETTVDRTSVWLRTFATDPAKQTRTVRVAYWRAGNREVTNGNATNTVPQAEDVIVEEHEVAFSAGTPVMEIPLQQVNETYQVTVWLKDKPEIRWRFTYDPVAIAESVSVDSKAELLGYVALWSWLPIAGGLVFGGYGSKRILERAGSGPGYPMSLWLILLVIGGGIIGVAIFDHIAELVAVAPWVVAAAVVSIGTLATLEYLPVNRRKVLFLRPDRKDVKAPSGRKGLDAVSAATQEEEVVSMPNGDDAVVRKGVLAFIARVFGEAARLPSRTFDESIVDPSGKYDELVLVDPDADRVLEYDQEGLTFAIPSVDRDNWTKALAVGAAVVLSAAAVGQLTTWLWAGAIVVVAILVIGITPHGGEVAVEPASVHQRRAWLTAMTEATEFDAAETVDEAMELRWEDQATNKQNTLEVMNKKDRTLTKAALAAEDVDPADTPDRESVLATIDDIDPSGDDDD